MKSMLKSSQISCFLQPVFSMNDLDFEIFNGEMMSSTATDVSHYRKRISFLGFDDDIMIFDGELALVPLVRGHNIVSFSAEESRELEIISLMFPTHSLSLKVDLNGS